MNRIYFKKAKLIGLIESNRSCLQLCIAAATWQVRLSNVFRRARQRTERRAEGGRRESQGSSKGAVAAGLNAGKGG